MIRFTKTRHSHLLPFVSVQSINIGKNIEVNADFYSNNYSNEDTRQNKYLDEENLCLP